MTIGARRLLVRLSSFPFSALTATSVVVGTTCTIVDGSRQNDCRDSMTWLGYIGWTLVAIGAVATFAPAALEHPPGGRRQVTAAIVAVLALCVCIGLAFIRLWLRSMCGIF